MKKLILWGMVVALKSYSCADGSMPAFGASNYPDIPFNHFVAGNLGIVTPDLATSYLVVVYRYMNHLPLSAEEQTDALTIWSDIFSENPYYPQPVHGLSDKTSKLCSYDSSDKEPTNSDSLNPYMDTLLNESKDYLNWREARLSALGLPTILPTPARKDDGQYWEYDFYSFYSHLAEKEDNINKIHAGPGFNYLVLATARLNAIKEALYKQDNHNSSNPSKIIARPELTAAEKDIIALWIEAQQQIFLRTMNGSEKARELLAKFPDKIPQLLKDDIQYSIAASYLYDGTPAGAETAAQIFAAVANKINYPWHDWAKYSQYRALSIAVRLMFEDNDPDIICAKNTPCRKLSDQSYEGMVELSKNAVDHKVKEAATDYANVILMQTKWRAQDVYESLLEDSFVHIEKKNFSDFIALSRNRKTDRRTELSSWLADVVSIRKDWYEEEHVNKLRKSAFDDAYSHWQNNPKNLAWLWLAVYTMNHGDANQQKALVKATLNVPAQEPALVPLRIALIEHFSHFNDSILEMNSKRKIIDDALAALKPGRDFSAASFLLNARVPFANSLYDFIEHAFFYPDDTLVQCELELNSYSVKPDSANNIMVTAANIINALPPSMLLEIVNMPNLPENYRSLLYSQLWVRSILFHDKMLEKAVSQEAMKYNSKLSKTITKMAETDSPDEKKTLFLTLLLKHSELSPWIDLELAQTWLESWQNGTEEDDFYSSFSHSLLWDSCSADCTAPPPAFLSPKQRLEYEAQLKLIHHLKDATHYISDSLIDLANRHPSDLRYAKLLALFIKATKATKGSSKNAFVTLKKLYPNSTWAKNTKYYY